MERDYILGTHDGELARLGLQHRAWLDLVQDCWQRAGFGPGMTLLDVGAGPGYATLDLAGVVGPSGRVIALERSRQFIDHATQACAGRDLHQVEFRERDLVEESWIETNMDGAWCRWVLSFVSDPHTVVHRLADSLRPGGTAAFHEYINYGSWRFAPRRPTLEAFVAQVMASWRADGGEPDMAVNLPNWLASAGLNIQEVRPLVHAVHPGVPLWDWPASFIEVNLQRLHELGRIETTFVTEARRELHEAASDPQSIMITPMVLEVIAEKPEA